MSLNLPSIRSEFPALLQERKGKRIVYLDNAATTQKPYTVLAAMEEFYERHNANVHRGMHLWAEEATDVYERARAVVQRFIGARLPSEIVFTKNCTEAINIAAQSWGGAYLRAGDTVLLTLLEHHSNIVPWLQLKEHMGIDVRWVKPDVCGHITCDAIHDSLTKGNVKLVAITGQSNVLGTRPQLAEIVTAAHAAGALVLVDAAQLIGHHPVDVQSIDCDFLAFSGHKLYGPTGIGVLYAKANLLAAMPPMLGGGMMIREVRFDGFSPADPPARFEAGTPPIAEAVGLGAAIAWMEQYAWDDIEAHEHELLQHAANALASVPGLKLLGPYAESGKWQAVSGEKPSGCISFTVDGIHPHDLTALLGAEGVCLRAGHHCCMPLHAHLGIAASTRLSIALYNTKEEIDLLPKTITRAKRTLQHL
jgi:cysteine desulfurase/selenocysteine lyase